MRDSQARGIDISIPGFACMVHAFDLVPLLLRTRSFVIGGYSHGAVRFLT